MQNFKNAQWIWTNSCAKNDEYGEFYSEFCHNGGKVTVNISADSNYALYINGKLATFGQYADFPYDKVYDTVDITDFCRNGKNSLAVVVWYYGLDTSSVYCPGNAAVMFEVLEDGDEVCSSGPHTFSRMSTTYKNHYCKNITWQVGYSFLYDASAKDNWMIGELCGFAQSTVVNQKLPLRPRPCEKLVLQEAVKAQKIKTISPTVALYDLGINTVGFLSVKITSSKKQLITVSYGEHIADGSVRRLIGGRDFSVEIIVPGGVTEYTNPFRRLGCKYIEINSEYPLDDAEISIIPTVYPVTEQPRPALTQKQNEIYDACLRTLVMCMHEHYEDCPWREQALYTMDSRNQMLIGYYAFGEYTFPRACLELISKDNRKDNLLSICYPVAKEYKIPSFSLHYFVQCEEYLNHSGDAEFIKSILPKLCSIMQVFVSRIGDDGCVLPFVGDNYWNFYEWRKGLEGYTKVDLTVPDIILNGLLSKSLASLGRIYGKLNEKCPFDCDALVEKINSGIIKNFYDADKKMFYDRPSRDTASVLGNSLAVLCGAADEQTAQNVCNLITSGGNLTPISLSMKCFSYDALIKVDSEKYKDYIFADIEKTYTPMLEYGTGTVWETEDGEKDFDNAGSLCHGWSALPIYYYHTLK